MIPNIHSRLAHTRRFYLQRLKGLKIATPLCSNFVLHCVRLFGCVCVCVKELAYNCVWVTIILEDNRTYTQNHPHTPNIYHGQRRRTVSDWPHCCTSLSSCTTQCGQFDLRTPTPQKLYIGLGLLVK